MLTNDILLVRLLSAGTEINKKAVVQWGVFSRNSELSGDVHIARLDELKEQWCSLYGSGEADKAKAPEKVILFLPGHLTINRLQRLNSGQKKHINSALPYIIEESLAEDIESIHIASHLHRKTDSVSLVAIPHKVIQLILSLFDEVAFAPDHIYSECQFVASSPETASLVLDSTHVIMATPVRASLALDYEAVPYALSQRAEGFEEQTVELDDKTGERISQVLLMSPSGVLNSPNEKAERLKGWLNAQGWLCKEEVLGGSVFEFLAEHYFQYRSPAELIDLRQGVYRCARRANRRLARWRPVMALVICWVVFELSIMIGQGFYFGRQADELWDQNADLYLTMFPQDRQVRDAKARNQRTFNLQTWLENRLRHSGKTIDRDNAFLALLHQLSAVTAEQGAAAAIIPQGMDFNSEVGHLIFEFSASSLDVVHQLESDLKAKGLQTRLDSANQGKTGVIAKMTVAR